MLKKGFFFSFLIFVSHISSAETFSGLIDDKWLQLDTPNFRVIGNIKAKNLKAISRNLEGFRYASALIVGVKPVEGNALTVFALRDSTDLRLLYPGKSAKNVAGFFFREMSNNYAVFHAGSFYRGGSRAENSFAMNTVYHEYCHYFKSQYTDLYYPDWFSEGFCEYLASLTIIDQSSFKIGGIAKGRVYSLDYYNWQNFADVMAEKKGLISMERPFESYAQSWLAVHYLYSHSQYAKKISPYIIAINKGEDESLAFQRVFGLSPDDFSKELKNYFRRKKYPNMTHKLRAPMREYKLEPIKLSRVDVIDHFAEYLQLSGVSDESFNQFFKAIVKDNKTVHVLAMQVEEAIRHSHWQQADKLIVEMVALYPDHRQTFLQMAHVDYAKAVSDPQQHHFENRRDFLQGSSDALLKILSTNRADVHAIFDLGVTSEALDPEDVLVGKLFETALYHSGNDQKIATTLVQYYYRMQRYDEALSLLLQTVLGVEHGKIGDEWLVLLDDLRDKVKE
jgi:hypothetical protein